MEKLISFHLHGRFGHFLRADAGASAISYPVPPRTALIGILGAVLGLEKDSPQELLEPMHIAMASSIPKTHWHKAKLRKDPPELLPYIVKIKQKLEKATKPERANLNNQEWLFNPSYVVWASLPEPFLGELELRIKERRWHFQPCLGLSEMMANIDYIDTQKVEKLPEGTYPVETIIRQDEAQLVVETAFQEKLAIHTLRMPRIVTPERVFSHANYFMERDGRPITVQSADAYSWGKRVLMFL